MKNYYYMLLLAAITFSVYASAQNAQLILQPGPGLNNGTDNGGANSGKDAFSFKLNPTTNYPDDAGFAAYPQSDCNDNMGELYLQFDVSGLPLDTEVDSAFVGFTHNPHTGNCFSNCDADFFFHRVTQNWSETTITYANSPTVDPVPFFGPLNITFPNDFGLVEYNITAMYRSWRNGTFPNYGFQIYSPTVGCNNAAVIFSVKSSDNTVDSLRPYLRLKGTFSLAGIHDNLFSSVSVYPNPAGDRFYISAPALAGDKLNVMLTDIAGRIVEVRSITKIETAMSFDVSNCSPGIYIISISDGKETSHRKFIKE